MRNKKAIPLITLLFIFIWISRSFALKEGTHKAINEEVAQKTINGFSLNTYLIDNFGIMKGVKEELLGIDADGRNVKKRIVEWLGYGGEQEDRPGSNWDYIQNNPSRSNNHFHNPLKTNWDEAGLNDFGKTGQSSFLWAQNINQDPNYNLGGEWSWQDAREYFYIVLTGKSYE